MEYILTAKELNALMPKSEHDIIVDRMQSQIDALHLAIYRQTPCNGNFEKFTGYCDDCVLSFFGTKTCPGTGKRYSK